MKDLGVPVTDKKGSLAQEWICLVKRKWFDSGNYVFWTIRK